MESFLSFIRYYIPLSKEAEAAIRKLARMDTFKKGDQIIAEGSVCKRQYFITSGSIRTYFYQKGKDVTYWIYPEDGIFTIWHSYWQQRPSGEYAEATEDCQAISISFDDWQELYKNFPELEKYGRLFSEEQLALVDEFYRGYYFLTAQEKYTLLLSIFPSVVMRANLGHIASMLGLSQETLSRIRAKRA